MALFTLNIYFQSWTSREGIIDDDGRKPAVPKGLDNGRMGCYMAQFQSFVPYMPVLTGRKVYTECTLIECDDFEEPPEMDEIFGD